MSRSTPSPRAIPVKLRTGIPARGIIAIQPTPCAGFACGYVIQPEEIFTRHYPAGQLKKYPLAFCVRCVGFVPSKCVRCLTNEPAGVGDYYCEACSTVMETESIEALAAAGYGDMQNFVESLREPDIEVVETLSDDELQALCEAQEAAEDAAFHELADIFMGRDDETLVDEE